MTEKFELFPHLRLPPGGGEWCTIATVCENALIVLTSSHHCSVNLASNQSEMYSLHSDADIRRSGCAPVVFQGDIFTMERKEQRVALELGAPLLDRLVADLRQLGDDFDPAVLVVQSGDFLAHSRVHLVPRDVPAVLELPQSAASSDGQQLHSLVFLMLYGCHYSTHTGH